VLIPRKGRKCCACDTIFKRSSIAGEEKNLSLNLDRPYRLKYSQVGHGIFVINVRLNEKEQFFSGELFYFRGGVFIAGTIISRFVTRAILIQKYVHRINIRVSPVISTFPQFQDNLSPTTIFSCPVIDRALRDRILNIDSDFKIKSTNFISYTGCI